MAEIVRMPKLSDTMTEGVVAEWHKNVGDQVESRREKINKDNKESTTERRRKYEGKEKINKSAPDKNKIERRREKERTVDRRISTKERQRRTEKVGKSDR
jgi:hypothetical protein